jgi:Rab proteins geranylgeranyltransferase component A
MAEQSNHYTHLLVGTSLTLSILAAALSQSTTDNVLLVDTADYYGSHNASLTLSQLVDFVDKKGKGSSNQSSRVTFPYFQQQQSGQGPSMSVEASSSGTCASSPAQKIPPPLERLDRHYSISISPALQPAVSPSLDVLIRSQVAKYATFRLLQRTAVWSSTGKGKAPLRTVPASKEDVFKTTDLTLIEKRKLMKFLQFAAGDYQKDAIYTQDDAASLPFADFLQKHFKLGPDLIEAIMFGIALCPSQSDATSSAMDRLQTHLNSVGKYGNSAYLVPQYGGAGEIAQGYCRAAAVQGATVVLGKEIEELVIESSQESGKRWKLRLKDIEETFTADCVLGEEALLGGRIGSSAAASEASRTLEQGKLLLQGILVFDRSIKIPSSTASRKAETSVEDSAASSTQVEEEPPIETGLIVFPPRSLGQTGESGQQSGINDSTVTALILGEGTFCCPKGQYVVHLTTEISAASTSDDAAKAIFEVAKQRILKLAKDSPREWSPSSEEVPASGPVVPLVELFWQEPIRYTSAPPSISREASTAAPLVSISPYFLPDQAAEGETSSHLSLPSILPLCTAQATHLFYNTLHGLDGPAPTVEDYLKWKNRGKKWRSEAEYRGRGGVGPDHEEEENDEAAAAGSTEQEMIFMFPPDLDAFTGAEDEE